MIWCLLPKKKMQPQPEMKMNRHDSDNLATAARLAGNVPGLLLAAEKIAHTVMRGTHGRRRVGQGETFWQFRDYQQGDSSRDIDWRQTAKRDAPFVRQLEWEASQTVWLYRDATESMKYRSSQKLPYKKDYAEILLLALAMIILDGGEQVSLLGTDLSPQAHAGAVERLYQYLPEQKDFNQTGRPVAARSDMILLSDFYMPVEDIRHFCAAHATRDVRGILVQVTDPAEENLPFTGRMKFYDIEDMAAAPLTVPQVEALRDAYQQKFAAHREALVQTAESFGWHFFSVSTDEKPEAALTRLYHLLSAKG
jgi:uncharacterized protein (DUF58 family)